MLKNLIFDWGGVCTYGHHLKDFSNNLSQKCDKSKEEIEKVFRDLDYPYETGQISPEEFWKNFSEQLNANISIPEIRETFLNAYTLNQDVLNFIKTLRPQYRVVLFSNNYADLFGHMKKIYELNNYFDITLCSADIHHKKPEPEVYEYFINELKLNPAETLFIDDKEKNIIPAHAAGFITHQFINLHELQKKLI